MSVESEPVTGLLQPVIDKAFRAFRTTPVRIGGNVVMLKPAITESVFFYFCILVVGFYAFFPVWDHIFEVQSPYLEVLGLPVGSHPSHAELNTAYKQQMRRWHPDRNPGCGAECARRVQLIRSAHSALTDPHASESVMSQAISERKESLLYWTQVLTPDIHMSASSAAFLVTALPWYAQSLSIFIALHVAMVATLFLYGRRNMELGAVLYVIEGIKVCLVSAPLYSKWATRRHAGARRSLTGMLPAILTTALAIGCVLRAAALDRDALRGGDAAAASALLVTTAQRLVVAIAITLGPLGERVRALTSCARHGVTPPELVTSRHLRSAALFDFVCYCFELPTTLRYVNVLALIVSVALAMQLPVTPIPPWHADDDWVAPPQAVAEEAEEASRVAEMSTWLEALVSRGGVPPEFGHLPAGTGVDEFHRLVEADIAIAEVLRGRAVANLTGAEQRTVHAVRMAAETTLTMAAQAHAAKLRRHSQVRLVGAGLMAVYWMFF